MKSAVHTFWRKVYRRQSRMLTLSFLLSVLCYTLSWTMILLKLNFSGSGDHVIQILEGYLMLPAALSLHLFNSYSGAILVATLLGLLLLTWFISYLLLGLFFLHRMQRRKRKTKDKWQVIRHFQPYNP